MRSADTLKHRKSSPGSQCIRLVIAECSLPDSLQVGLLMAASEKKGGRMTSAAGAVRSLQSGLASKNREKWAEFAHLVESKGRNSLQCRLSGGGKGIRTSGTVLNRANADVCVSYMESISSKFPGEFVDPRMNVLNSPVS